jgi:hypothetical protein
VLPVVVLFADSGRFVWPVRAALKLEPLDEGEPVPVHTFWVLNLVLENMILIAVILVLFSTAYVFPLAGLGSHYGTPWDTFCLIALWLLCGWLVIEEAMREERAPEMVALLDTAQLVELGADVERAHERFADEDGPDTRIAEADDVFPRPDAAFTDETDAGRDA